MVVNLTDLTELKRLQANLQQAQKMEAVGTLAGGIAHDFNNLFRSISGYAQILMLDKDEELRTILNSRGSKQAAERAAQLIQQLLTFSRRVESRRCPVDFNEVIRQSVDLLHRTIPRMVDIRCPWPTG
jgi:C4-dicarboxylate-specific signal transduction histidine kinase